MKKIAVVGGLLLLLGAAACSADEAEEPSESSQTDSGASAEESQPSSEDTDEETKPEAPSLNEEGVVEDPEAVDMIVNRDYHLSSDYEPEDLIQADIRYASPGDDPKNLIREPAAAPLEQLFADAESTGHELYAISGYRSYERQDIIFTQNAERDGEEQANTYSAKPGESEHQSGLAMDVSSRTVGNQLNTDFGDTPEGRWIAENAHKYGFIVRYPEDKTDITGYQYEPWHLRYVGEELSEELYEENLTLEEYYGLEG
ncbi:D-alanyl-D-alanine carboxypeptidase family protein [Sinobaca sp. H24]|uniref:M15 family metallopeptidase n=1 Tax=Sinobaca sp. H24 TaxID=2923376 RepID=UPI00207A33B2|nr:M15 family metallopeptidase [Sinobaca sp. H24]